MYQFLLLLLTLVPDRVPVRMPSVEPPSILGQWYSGLSTIIISVNDEGDIIVTDPRDHGWRGIGYVEHDHLYIVFDVRAANGRWVGKYWFKKNELTGWYTIDMRDDDVLIDPTHHRWTRDKDGGN